MREAHLLAESWGFTPKTIITWGKIKKDRAVLEPSMKTGWWFRSATEHCIFAVRGGLRLACAESLPTLFLSERLAHSIKPEAFQDMVEKTSQGPYLELFARRIRPNWTCWGNEIG
jgi:N6-adenosine-specific RNA methylase IME4